MIDKRKWEERFPNEKYDFIQAVFNTASIDCVSKDDLVMMCNFMLDMISQLKLANKELSLRLDELTTKLNKTTYNPKE